MPTKNEEYNWLLKKWAALTGNSQQAACESCGSRLEGKDVYETKYNWVCRKCYDECDDTGDYYMSDEYLRRMERQQMGRHDF